MKRIFAITVLCILCKLNLSIAASDIAALVNNEPITNYELEARKSLLMHTQNLSFNTKEQKDTFHKAVLNQLIEEVILKQNADSMGIKVTEKTLDAVIKGIEKRNNLPSGGMFALIEQENLSVESYKSQITYELLKNNIITMVADEVKVYESEVYDAALNEQNAKIKTHVWLFSVKDDSKESYKKLQKLQKELRSYTPKTSSIKSFTHFADALDITDYDKLSPAAQITLKDTQDKTASTIFQDGNKLYVLFVLSKELVKDKEQLERIREEISNTRTMQKANLFLKNLHSKAHIVINQ